jgi:hypothetical protein
MCTPHKVKLATAAVCVNPAAQSRASHGIVGVDRLGDVHRRQRRHQTEVAVPHQGQTSAVKSWSTAVRLQLYREEGRWSAPGTTCTASAWTT